MSENNNLLVKYYAKGDTDFQFNFKVDNITEVVVWVDNKLQSLSDYEIDISDNNTGGIVKFNEMLGTSEIPVLVTIFKKSQIKRCTDFSNFSTFRVESLNYELNNYIDIMSSLSIFYNNMVMKSNLEENDNVILPNSSQGKGIYWGSNGELLNTDLNINDFLNELAANNPSLPSSKIKALNISVDNTKTTINNTNVQDFLVTIDTDICSLINANANIKSNIESLSSDINSITNSLNTYNTNIQNNITSINSINVRVKAIENEISSSSSSSVNSYPLYSIIRYPKDTSTFTANYISDNSSNFKLDIVNIAKDTPFIFNILYKGMPTVFTLDDISNQAYTTYFECTASVAGRYYLYIDIDDDKKISFKGTLNRPYFGYNKPTSDILNLYGCNTSSDYFFTSNFSMHYGNGRYKDKEMYRIYVAYVDLDDKGSIVGSIVYFNEGVYFEQYIDISANNEYIIPNYIGCNHIEVKLEILGTDNNQKYVFLATNQGNLDNTLASVLNMGTNFAYNFDNIKINTANKGILGYYKGDSLFTLTEGKLKISVKRQF